MTPSVENDDDASLLLFLFCCLHTDVPIGDVRIMFPGWKLLRTAKHCGTGIGAFSNTFALLY